VVDGWIDETIFNQGDDFFAAFEQAIQKAKQSIHVETYIFDLDTLGLKILDLLARAAKRGVQVKLLLDGIGSSEWNNELANRYRKQGIDVQFFHPLFWQRPSLNIKLPNFRLMNHRDHRKLYLVDDQTAFVGSMNISARHLKSVYGNLSWRDTSVILTGKPVSALQDSFWVSWNTATDHISRPKEVLKRFFSKLKMPILLKHTLRQRRMYREFIIQKINETKSSIWITTPYFVPDRKVLASILEAAQRGIDVRLLFPKVSDFFGVKYAMEGYYFRLLRSGARIYEYLPSMLHAKIMMLDDFISLGSSNLNHRSFFKDLEVDVLLSRPESITLLKEQFLEDLTHCEQRKFEAWKHRPLHRKIFEKFFFLFRGTL
jgi:cardiolipin synthase